MSYEFNRIIRRELEAAREALLDAQIKEAMSSAAYDLCNRELGNLNQRTKAYWKTMIDAQCNLSKALRRFNEARIAMAELEAE